MKCKAVARHQALKIADRRKFTCCIAADIDNPSHLAIILDLFPTQWHLSSLPKNAYPHSFKSFLAQTLAFLNFHLTLKHENALVVYGAFPGKSVLLYSSTDHKAEGADDSIAVPNTYLPFKVVDTAVTKRISEELDAMSDFDEEALRQLVGALTKALCRTGLSFLKPCSNLDLLDERAVIDINWLVNPTATSIDSDVPVVSPEPRIVILSVSPDLSTSYIPLMNSIFSAQNLCKVAIDVCKIYAPDAVFLQQAAHLTGGSYIYLERRDALLQHLLMTFLPTPSIRQPIAVPTQDKIDFRVACFFHKTIVDIGFVCSVRLSILCQLVPVCSTCRTKFPIKNLQRLNVSRPTPPPGQRASSVAPSGARMPVTPTPGGTGTGTGTLRPTAPSALGSSLTLNVGSMSLGSSDNIRTNGSVVTASGNATPNSTGSGLG
ncbi:Tfb4-domain-containing protein [Fomitiporia mediterranea MF3/22]|uniref:Tfb4-domain-containing protein n=1 Tax=Fomitiporia mediterranea (strain MF3/22) TaxID=694068 RepID=UPI0004407A3B|nr:Tfb4-domain-containing protein [Fomitiporia mediterranea MF3/22]EJD02839.1 Tfb4-domain-containing protein [Fomitiporia mediterranea MF3/22]